MPYSATFPTRPPADHDDPACVAAHDRDAFDGLDRMLCHWDRPHRRSWHWMVTLGEHPRVVEASQQCHTFLPEQGLDLIRPESLHLTVQRLGYIDETPVSAVDSAVSAAGEHCNTLGPFRLQLIPLAGSPGAVRFSAAPWSPLLEMYRVTAEASGVGSVDPLAHYRPHVGIAYSNQRQPIEPIRDAVRKARTAVQPVEITVREVQLVELDRRDRQYQWQVLQRLPLRGDETPARQAESYIHTRPDSE